MLAKGPMYVFINRQWEKSPTEMSQAEDWNHMGLVESNSSCDNIARRSPTPPPPKSLTLSHVTAVQEGLQLEKVNRWLGPRTKWSPFSKSTCGIWGGNGFAAKQSIICNYNNLTSENGLFHFIRRVALSCLIVWTWWEGGGGRNRDRGLQQMRQTDGALSECTLIFIIYWMFFQQERIPRVQHLK